MATSEHVSAATVSDLGGLPGADDRCTHPAGTPPERVVLITGAAQRLGAATARRLHGRGWRIALHCRQSRAAADVLASELNALRADSCRVLVADLSRDEDIARLAREAVASWGRVDALVNNASSFYPTPVGDATPAQWDDLFASNARAPFFLAQALLPALRAARGAIVNLLDIHAERPLGNHTLYCMAKAANRMLVESLARELAPEVRVNGIAPGAILWPPQGEPDAAAQARVLAGIPMGRLGTPEDIAGSITFLLEEAPYITGQVLAVDGGRSL